MVGIAVRQARRAEVALVGLLLMLAVVAWAVTVDRMRGMDAGPGTDPGTVGFFVGVWVVMMAAMMLPSMAPMVAVYARLARVRGATALFVGGYFAVWTAAGLAAFAIAKAGRDASLGVFSWDRGGRYLAGGILLAAAAYQLTPLKDRCLTRCRGPLAFVLSSWRDGRAGALLMGAEHGAWCVGCCWALMAALFAVGVMSIGWMAFVAALVAIEKLLPWKAVANRGTAVLLALLGLGVAFAPGSVPGLTIPHAMGGMM
jgi:predicted metal-binding membrane protein